MKFTLFSSFIILSLIIAASCNSSFNNDDNTIKSAQNNDKAFLAVKGKNLLGDLFAFPQNLQHDYNLLAVAFLRKQQSDVDTWIPNMENLENKYSNFMFYELPTIKKMDPFSKWFIFQGMRGGIPSEKARTRTVTLHIDKEPFKHALGIETEDRIYLFLVNKDGLILWKGEELWTKEKENEIEKFLMK